MAEQLERLRAALADRYRIWLKALEWGGIR